MKTVLFVDFLCPIGHIGFNNIYIRALTHQKNFKVDLAFSESYFKNLNCSGINHCYRLPDNLFQFTNGILSRFTNRKVILKLQSYVKTNINLSSYDLILVSSFETITTLFTKFPEHTVLICHNNVNNTINSLLHLLALKKIAKRHQLVVFNVETKNFLKSKGIINATEIPHGIREPFDSLIPTYDSFKYENEHVVFLPSCNSADIELIQQIINSLPFNNLLKSQNIRLVIKSVDLQSNFSNISVINKYLTEDEYKNLFIRADYIFLPYRTDFKYHISAILYEAISNNKQVIIRDIEGFSYLNNVTSNAIFFTDFLDLFNQFRDIIEKKEIPNYSEFKNSNSLEVINSAINSLN